MGQAMQKLTQKQEGGQMPVKLKKKIEEAIEKYTEKHGEEYLQKAINTEAALYHVVYEIVTILNEESDAMHFKLPSIEKLQEAYTKAREGSRSPTLTKKEFSQIINEVVWLGCFSAGRGARDIFLYIFGVPIVALLAKRVIPGPTRAISDEVFIPLSTTATVVFLAKTNRL